MGLLDSAKSLMATVVATVQNRVELFSTEFQEELARLVSVLLWSIAALLCAVVGLTFLAVTILLVVDARHRVLTAAIVGVVFVAGAVGSVLHVRGLLKARSRPFDASLSELEKDYRGLKEKR